MTKREAVENIKGIRDWFFPDGSVREALDMGIKALESYTFSMTPVSSSLPPSEGVYLVIARNGVGKDYYEVSDYIDNGMCYWWGIEAFDHYTVKAWAELPPLGSDITDSN